MEYQRIINLLDNTSNQQTKFRKKYWVEVNHVACGTYNTNSHIEFKTSMLKSSLCDYSDAYMLVSGTITVPNTGTKENLTNIKNIITKYCTPLTDCISEINNTQLDNANYINIVMPMYTLREYSDNYSKTSGNLWQDYRGEPFSDDNGAIADFPAHDNNSASFKLKKKQAE